MRFGYSEEQRQLGETARRLFERQFRAEVVRRFADGGPLDPAWTREMSEAGLFGICAPAEVGGLGLGVVDAIPLLTEAGRHLVPYPLVESIVASRLLAGWQDGLAAAVIEGRTIVAIAWDAEIAATPEGQGASGILPAVGWAQHASHLLVRQGDDLLLVDLAGRGVRCEVLGSLDLGCRMARLVLDDANAVRLPGATPALLRHGALLITADMLGAAEAVFEQTVAYLKQRRQFGQLIGAFQALKHIAADDATRVESMRVALQYAAWAVDAGTPDADIAVSIAKSYAADAARTVVADAVQLHGGIAYTWDFGLHLPLRRIHRCAAMCGGAEVHREAIAAALIDSRVPHHPARAA
jgi:alkylation response protein AidB-like acyl-CoA dehydrogenase